MDKFTSLTGVAAPMPIINIDTDMIIPKQYLKTIKRTGLGSALFSEMRYNDDGSENPDFVLNKPAYRQAKIIVAGDNFGCGSSREHAPWSLLDFGIRCVISTSFADIFYNNCFKNGILPIVVTPEQLALLMDDAERGSNATITVDLESQTIKGPDGGTLHFDIDPSRKQTLLEGLDDIAATLKADPAISGFEQKMQPEPALALMVKRISSGSPFEKKIGYSRAVVDGDIVYVSGTTGYDYSTMTMPADAARAGAQRARHHRPRPRRGRLLAQGRRARPLLPRRHGALRRDGRRRRRNLRRHPPRRHDDRLRPHDPRDEARDRSHRPHRRARELIVVELTLKIRPTQTEVNRVMRGLGRLQPRGLPDTDRLHPDRHLHHRSKDREGRLAA